MNTNTHFNAMQGSGTAFLCNTPVKGPICVDRFFQTLSSLYASMHLSESQCKETGETRDLFPIHSGV